MALKLRWRRMRRCWWGEKKSITQPSPNLKAVWKALSVVITTRESDVLENLLCVASQSFKLHYSSKECQTNWTLCKLILHLCAAQIDIHETQNCQSAHNNLLMFQWIRVKVDTFWRKQKKKASRFLSEGSLCKLLIFSPILSIAWLATFRVDVHNAT